MLVCGCERRACTLSIVLHFAFKVFMGKLQQVTVTFWLPASTELAFAVAVLMALRSTPFCMDSQDNDMHLT